MTQAAGLTRDVSWNMGVRRTVPMPLETVWRYLLGPGTGIWLGHTPLSTRRGDRYVTADGIGGEVRSYTANRRIRLTWQPHGWDHDSTLQLTVLEAKTGTTIAIHQERLASQAERTAMLTHWTAVLGRLIDALTDADRRP